MPDKYNDVVSQAAEDKWIYHRGSAEHAKYIRHYHIMNYEYTFSDIPDKQPMSPNPNLYNAPLPVAQWVINDYMQGYLYAGVTIAPVGC